MSKFASLTAGLLARKGEAEPVSTPFADQLLTRVGAPSADIRALTPMPHPHVHTHEEPGAPAKPQGLKAPVVKPVEPLTAIFGTFGRRIQDAQRKEEARKAAERVEGDIVFEPMVVPIVPQEEEEHVESQCGSCVGPMAEDAGKSYHVNLRLKRLRFVKLKLSAALLRRPVQDIVAEALDSWFDKLPPDVLGDCACMKARGE